MFEKYENDIRITCEEILLELKDVGYKYYIELNDDEMTLGYDINDGDVETVYIEIHRKGIFPRWFNDSVSDYLDRIDDYLETKGIVIIDNCNMLQPIVGNTNDYYIYRKYKRK